MEKIDKPEIIMPFMAMKIKVEEHRPDQTGEWL